jgi:nitroreductase
MIDNVFRERRSVRNFQDWAISQKDIKRILESAHSAPSAGNLKARDIVIVKDKKTKKAIAEAALSQNFIAGAPIVLIFFATDKSIKKYGGRGILYAIQDATIACSFACVQATMLGLGSCWIGAFDEDEIISILKVNKNWSPVAILPVGYKND